VLCNLDTLQGIQITQHVDSLSTCCVMCLLVANNTIYATLMVVVHVRSMAPIPTLSEMTNYVVFNDKSQQTR